MSALMVTTVAGEVGPRESVRATAAALRLYRAVVLWDIWLFVGVVGVALFAGLTGSLRSADAAGGQVAALLAATACAVVALVALLRFARAVPVETRARGPARAAVGLGAIALGAGAVTLAVHVWLLADAASADLDVVSRVVRTADTAGRWSGAFGTLALLWALVRTAGALRDSGSESAIQSLVVFLLVLTPLEQLAALPSIQAALGPGGQLAVQLVLLSAGLTFALLLVHLLRRLVEALHRSAAPAR